MAKDTIKGVSVKIGADTSDFIKGLKKIDKEINMPLRGKEGLISTSDSKVKVVVIPTDEEVMIARDTVKLLKL